MWDPEYEIDVPPGYASAEDYHEDVIAFRESAKACIQAEVDYYEKDAYEVSDYEKGLV